MLLLALHVPKALFVFAFEGALLAFIVIGDRFVLLALLPRRKPRTDGSVQPPYHSYQRTQPHHRRVLPFPCASWPMAWISVYCGSGTAAPRGAQPFRAARFRFRASFTVGGRCRSLSQRFDNRCRRRRPGARTKARCKRTSTAETGSRSKRRSRGGNHEPTSCLHWH